VLDAEVRWSNAGRVGVRFVEQFDLAQLSPSKGRPNVAMLRPEYLATEADPDSPWAARTDRLSPDTLRSSM
jgi:hypothetical protein